MNAPIYGKGDPLCKLGFHPQVRFPLKCKRCYRDYKEHTNHRNQAQNDVTTSTPSLSFSGTSRDNNPSRVWTSSTNLSSSVEFNHLPKRPSSWTSTPDLDDANDSTKPDISVSIQLPRRRHTANLDLSSIEESSTITVKRPPIPPKDKEKEEIIIYKTDSLAERVRKMSLIKKQGSVERETSRERSVPKKIEK